MDEEGGGASWGRAWVWAVARVLSWDLRALTRPCTTLISTGQMRLESSLYSLKLSFPTIVISDFFGLSKFGIFNFKPDQPVLDVLKWKCHTNLLANRT